MSKMVVLAAALAAPLAASSAQAQTYDPAFPVCMHVFGELEGERMDCVFTSLDQCRASAYGRPAMCLVNPNFAHASRRPPAKTGRRPK